MPYETRVTFFLYKYQNSPCITGRVVNHCLMLYMIQTNKEILSILHHIYLHISITRYIVHQTSQSLLNTVPTFSLGSVCALKAENGILFFFTTYFNNKVYSTPNISIVTKYSTDVQLGKCLCIKG